MHLQVTDLFANRHVAGKLKVQLNTTDSMDSNCTTTKHIRVIASRFGHWKLVNWSVINWFLSLVHWSISRSAQKKNLAQNYSIYQTRVRVCNISSRVPFFFTFSSKAAPTTLTLSPPLFLPHPTCCTTTHHLHCVAIAALPSPLLSSPVFFVGEFHFLPLSLSIFVGSLCFCIKLFYEIRTHLWKQFIWWSTNNTEAGGSFLHLLS